MIALSGLVRLNSTGSESKQLILYQVSMETLINPTVILKLASVLVVNHRQMFVTVLGHKCQKSES